MKVAKLTGYAAFIPDYNVSKAQRIVVGADLSENLTVPGSEAGGTSQIKFMMNATAILGSHDGTNLEIRRAVTDANIFLFEPQPNGQALSDRAAKAVDFLTSEVGMNLADCRDVD